MANSLLVKYMMFINDVRISCRKTSSSNFHRAVDHTLMLNTVTEKAYQLTGKSKLSASGLLRVHFSECFM